MPNLLNKLCTAAFDQGLDHLVSRSAIANVDPYFHKLMVIEGSFKLGLNPLSQALAANGDNRVKFMCDCAVLLKKSVVQGEALVK